MTYYYNRKNQKINLGNNENTAIIKAKKLLLNYVMKYYNTEGTSGALFADVVNENGGLICCLTSTWHYGKPAINL